MAFVKSLEELESANCQNCILIVGGELAATPLQPKEYPFYYPDEHKYLIELLERKQPAAIIAATAIRPATKPSPTVPAVISVPI